MIKYILFIGILLMLSCESSKFSYCSFNSGLKLTNKDLKVEPIDLGSDSKKKVKKILDEIAFNSLPYADYALVPVHKNSNIEIAAAVFIKNQRYIYYNPAAFDTVIFENIKSDPIVLGVLCHEMGHLLYNHTKKDKVFESLADQYAGWMQRKLEVTRIQSITALQDLIKGQHIHGDKIYPDLPTRILSTERGWDIANSYLLKFPTTNFPYRSFSILYLQIDSTFDSGFLNGIDIEIQTFNKTNQELSSERYSIKDNIVVLNKPIRYFEGFWGFLPSEDIYFIRIALCDCRLPCNDSSQRNCIRQDLLYNRVSDEIVIPFNNSMKVAFKFYK